MCSRTAMDGLSFSRGLAYGFPIVSDSADGAEASSVGSRAIKNMMTAASVIASANAISRDERRTRCGQGDEIWRFIGGMLPVGRRPDSTPSVARQLRTEHPQISHRQQSDTDQYCGAQS